MTWAIDTADARRRIISCALEVPAEGAWWLDATCDGDVPITGPVTCTLGTTTWLGTAWASQVDGARIRVRIIGGAGGLEVAVTDRQENGAHVTVEEVARSTLAIGGEALGSAPSTQLGSWMRMRGTVGTALDDLCRTMGLRWRVSRAGTVDVYRQAPEVAEAAGVVRERRSDSTVHGVDDFGAEPPMVGVEHVSGILTAKGDASVIFRATSPRAVLRSLEDARPHSRIWSGRMTSQDGQFVKVAIDAESSRGAGPGSLPGNVSQGAWAIDRVPLWPGIPGVTLELRQGAGLLVLFREDDPRKPIAIPSPYGEKATSVTIETEGGARIRLIDDRFEIGGQTYTLVRWEPLRAWLLAHEQGIIAAGGAVTPPPLYPTVDFIKASGPGRVG